MTTRAHASRVVLVPFRGELTPTPLARGQQLLLIVLHFLKLGVDHVIGTGGLRLRIAAGRAGLSLGRLRSIHLLRDSASHFGQLRRRSLDGRLVVAFERLLGVGDGRLDRSLLLRGGVFASVLERFARRVHHAVAGVARGYQFR